MFLMVVFFLGMKRLNIEISFFKIGFCSIVSYVYITNIKFFSGFLSYGRKLFGYVKGK